MATISVSGFAFSAADPFNDGFANAKPGTAQFPTLLSGYAHRPPWKVAGVDYAVGIYSNCTVNTGTSVITLVGSQATPINGEHRSFRAVGGGTIPTGVSAATAYVVLNVSGATFQVATLGAPTTPISLSGSPSGVVSLKIPTTGNMPTGISFDGSFSVGLGGSGLTPPTPLVFDGWDMSFANGMTISGLGYQGPITINNCYFMMGSNLITFMNGAGGTISPGPVTLSYCEADGNGVNFEGQDMAFGIRVNFYLMPSGTIEYCYLHGSQIETVEFDVKVTGTFQYNLTYNCGFGPTTNHMEMFSGQNGFSTYKMQYSAFYQPVGGTGGYPLELDTSMIFFQSTAGQTSTGITIDSNTFIGLGTTGHLSTDNLTNHPAINWVIGLDAGPGNGATGTVITNNYMDSTGMEPLGFCISTDSSIITPTISGNISMTTGVTIAANVPGTQ